MATRRVKKVMTQPINVMFKLYQTRTRVQVWLHEQPSMRLEGFIMGFDEHMNTTLDEAEELDIQKKTRRPLGRILLKGDNICLIMSADGKFTTREGH
eukprot:CAMPEP_0196781308 /NCGR_PEP_ID=MMETSP1104-20130614/9495_1 /TAXON_ID=33652 /ORGANISM="Cafeteria sp., Strain Caron Lab Isolate" /LENGTH=96 /DNA_ID=CAMNT_0042151537 /DNA_START=18 /DNA_END=308 /DNA_ORIENTATION=+